MANPTPVTYSAPSSPVVGGRWRIPPGNYRIAIWGQSNALGAADQSDLGAAPLASDPDMAHFITNGFSRVFFSDGSSYSELSMTNNGASVGKFGVEFALGVRWMRETTGGNIYIEKEAWSGTSIDPKFDPSKWEYAAMVSRRAARNAWLASRGLVVSDAGFVWIQGETDAGQTQSWYETRLAALLAARDSDGMQTPSTKRLLTQIPTTGTAWGPGVDAAKAALAAASPSNTLAPRLPNYMKADNVHQNGRGAVQAGFDIFQHVFSVGPRAT